jgi:chemotaxis protein histidine kinase CheA
LSETEFVAARPHVGWYGSSPERRRLTLALLLSLLIHTLLLSLIFGGAGWFPGFAFPWQDRRIVVPDLRVVVVPAQVTAAEPAIVPAAEPLQQASVEQPAASALASKPSGSRVPPQPRFAEAIMPKAKQRAEANPRTEAMTGTAPAKTPLRADRPGDTAPPPIPAPAVVALPRTDEATTVVPAAPAMPPPVIATTPSVSIPEVPMPSLRDAGDAAWARIDQQAEQRVVELLKLDPSKQEDQRQAEQRETARQDAARQEAARAENARLEAERARQAASQQEAARQEAARQESARAEAARAEAAKIETAKIETAKIETAKIEAAKIEAAKIEAAKIEAAKIEAAKAETAKAEAAKAEAAKAEAAKAEAARAEAARAEAARAEAARAEAARAEAARAEAARAEAARAEAARAEAAKIEAARVEAAQVAAERLEAARRAIGRQLDEEAARRDAAARLSPSSSSARRYRLFGRTDPNAELILYAEAWARKIQLNMTFDMVREPAKQRHADPHVTVAIRRDGSVESVTFVQSSGVAAIDDAIRRIVYSQAPYQVFPPALASEYDVIEIRRTWYFDVAIRLY